MRMPALMLTLCMLAACGPQAPAPVAAAATASTDAFLVLPGDYSERTTRAALEARFGKDKVRVAADDDGPLLVLFPQDPGRRAYLRFHDGESFTNLASIQVRDSGSRWRGKQGVHIGMSLARLRELNGKPFGFFGFDPDRRAYVHDRWSPALDDDDTTLGAFDVGEHDHLYFDVELGLRADAAEPGAADLPLDESTSSDDPRYLRMDELVVVTGFGASSSLDDEWE